MSAPVLYRFKKSSFEAKAFQVVNILMSSIVLYCLASVFRQHNFYLDNSISFDLLVVL